MDQSYKLIIRNLDIVSKQKLLQKIEELTLQYNTKQQELFKSTTSTTCFNNLRGNQLPAALKEAHVSVNKYINPLNFEAYETNCII